MLRRIDQPFATLEKNRNIFSKNIPFAIRFNTDNFHKKGSLIPPKILRCLSKCENIESLHLNNQYDSENVTTTSYDEKQQIKLTKALVQLKGQSLYLGVNP